MSCILCFNVVDKMQKLQRGEDDDTINKIFTVLPKRKIPESKEPLYICTTCLEQLSCFHTIKRVSLENFCRLKQFKSNLKGTSNLKSSELKIISSDETSTQRKNHIEFKVHLDSKDLLSLEDQDAPIHIKEEVEEYEQYRPQFIKVECNLDESQDDGTSSSCNNSAQQHENVGSYEFVDVNKFTEKDTNSASNCSDYDEESESKTQHTTKERRFKCSDCNKAFTRRSNLENHIRVHTGERPFNCPTCYKSFTRSTNLARHRLIHTGEKPHGCDVCNKTFSDKGDLIKHKRIHDNIRPYQCTLCNKAFTVAGNLGAHMRVHSGIKPHQCYICKYKCIQAYDLKRHIQFHTGARPHVCTHCNKTFSTTSNLNYHSRKFHENEDSK